MRAALPSPESLAERSPVLETPRLLLRPLRTDDTAAIRAIVSKPEVARGTISWAVPYADGSAESFVAYASQAYTYGSFFIRCLCHRADGRVIGTASVRPDTKHRHGELGYMLDSAYWGQGLMPEAVSRLIAWCFDDLDFIRVYATHFSDNPASGRVMQKCGMQHEGHLRAHYLRFGEPKDVELYGLVRA